MLSADGASTVETVASIGPSAVLSKRCASRKLKTSIGKPPVVGDPPPATANGWPAISRPSLVTASVRAKPSISAWPRWLESSSRGELGDRQVAGLDRAVAQGEVMSVKALQFHGIDGERGGAEALPLEQAGGGTTDQIDAIAPSADTG